MRHGSYILDGEYFQSGRLKAVDGAFAPAARAIHSHFHFRESHSLGGASCRRGSLLRGEGCTLARTLLPDRAP